MAGRQPLPMGKVLLFCGYYLNGLLMHLLPREDAHTRLFSIAPTPCVVFADGAQESALRCFR
ncbi:MAG: hypothetical protein IPK44_14700 [Candidatus Accumulibacter sp.]|uniref:hypothetical protein n=1 Tax=Accumulibacter sp. TaxID=2053492 RepID=UPI00258D41A8|nr:hypothetical protein [Accumulibacter sp.]MBK8115674.1 hypothetical protein [Accumulibacter sp.]